ncbi:MAG: hypothetical protein ACI9HX_000733 [Pseudoalteromonas tetraodonis]|jgi:hypothetical protein
MGHKHLEKVTKGLAEVYGVADWVSTNKNGRPLVADLTG